MANREHVELLKQGVDVWNKWRSEHPRTRPDLSQAPTTEFDSDVRVIEEAVINELMPGRGPVSDGGLGGLNLGQVNLHRANLV